MNIALQPKKSLSRKRILMQKDDNTLSTSKPKPTSLEKPTPNALPTLPVETTKADNMQVSGNHYKEMPIQPWAVMEAVLTHEEFVGFLKGNILKYSLRAGRKEGSDDVNKAWHYKQKLMEVTDGHNTRSTG
jgi:hypothetical protein